MHETHIQLLFPKFIMFCSLLGWLKASILRQFLQILFLPACQAGTGLKIGNAFSCLCYDAFSTFSVASTNSQSLTSDTGGLNFSLSLCRALDGLSGMAFKSIKSNFQNFQNNFPTFQPQPEVMLRLFEPIRELL